MTCFPSNVSFEDDARNMKSEGSQPRQRDAIQPAGRQARAPSAQDRLAYESGSHHLEIDERIDRVNCCNMRGERFVCRGAASFDLHLRLLANKRESAVLAGLPCRR